MTVETPGYRGRTAVSVTSNDPLSQLTRAVETFQRVNRVLPNVTIGREELITLGALLTHISGALLTLTDLLSAPAHQCDRTQLRRTPTSADRTARRPAAPRLLQNCRDGFHTAHTHAREFHEHLKR